MERLDDNMTEIKLLVPGVLAVTAGPSEKIKRLKNMHEVDGLRFVTSMLHTQYIPFAADFGPVNLGIVHRFCYSFARQLTKKRGEMLVYCVQESVEDQANASFLLGALLISHFGWNPEKVAALFEGPDAPLITLPFRDATFEYPTSQLSLRSCLMGLSKAISLRWFDWNQFDPKLYAQLDNPKGGDIHQICPKFVAFKGPLSLNSKYLQPNEIALPPRKYASILSRLGVTCVVRLNEPDTYDKREFEEAGIRHYDLYFDDCTIPSVAVIQRFLGICDREERVAVHCRAGLGRTGTLIALWMMKYTGFTADEAVAWLRIVRPGSVIGSQHEYLRRCEARHWCGKVQLPITVSEVTSDTHTSSKYSICKDQECFSGLQCDELPVCDARSAEALAAQVTATMCLRSLAKAGKEVPVGRCSAPSMFLQHLEVRHTGS